MSEAEIGRVAPATSKEHNDAAGGDTQPPNLLSLAQPPEAANKSKEKEAPSSPDLSSQTGQAQGDGKKATSDGGSKDSTAGLKAADQVMDLPPGPNQKQKGAGAEQTDSEPAMYKRWYEGFVNGTLSYDDSLRLANQYLQKYGDFAKFENADQVRFLQHWVEDQKKRPAAEIDLRDQIRDNKIPSDNEIGLRIARSLGFTDEEIGSFAMQNGKTNPEHFGEAFYKGSGDPNANKYWVDRARQDLSGGLVEIPELKSGAIQQLKDWRDHHRAELGPHVEMERAKLTAFEEIYKHIYNPVASFGESGLKTIGDIVQGLGLPAHLFTDKTFMDDFAKYLRQKGESLPMMGLYTDDEMHDALVMIANIYGSAAGAGAIYMTPGAAAGILRLSPAAATIVADTLGAAGNAGQVYDTSMTRQASHVAMEELQSGRIKQADFAHRVEEIKDGKVDPAERELMERRALISAAFAAPAGVLQGHLLNELSTRLISGVPVENLPADLIRNISLGLGKGAALGTAGLAANEGAMVLSGVQTPGEAGANIKDNLGQAALGGALVFGTAEGLATRPTGQSGSGEGEPGKTSGAEGEPGKAGGVEGAQDKTGGVESKQGKDGAGEGEHGRSASDQVAHFTEIDEVHGGPKLSPAEATALIKDKPAHQWSMPELMEVMNNWEKLPNASKESFLAQFNGLDEPASSNPLTDSGNRDYVLDMLKSYGEDSIPPSMRGWFEQQIRMREAIPERITAGMGTEMIRNSADFARDYEAMSRSLGAEEIVKEHQDLAKKVDALIPENLKEFADAMGFDLKDPKQYEQIADFAKMDPQMAKEWESYLAARKSLEPEIARVSEQMEQVREKFQTLSDKYADRLGVPKPQIVFVDDLTSLGRFGVNSDTIQIATSSLHNPEQVALTLAHEMTHAEQYALVVQSVADDLGISSSPSAQQLAALRTKLGASLGEGVNPSDEYLSEVLSKHTQPLDAAQKARADNLADSFKDMVVRGVHGDSPDIVMKQLDNLQQGMEHDLSYNLIEPSIERFKQLLFNSQPVPEGIAHLIEGAKTGDAAARQALYQVMLRYVNAAIDDVGNRRFGTYRARLHEQEAAAVGKAVQRDLSVQQ